MKTFTCALAAASALAIMSFVTPAGASQDNPQKIEKADLSGLRDFDFLVGEWRYLQQPPADGWLGQRRRESHQPAGRQLSRRRPARV
jgi:hypothetical protein